VSGISGEFSGCLIIKALTSSGPGPGPGPCSVKLDLELSVPVCSASALGLSRGLSERCRSLLCNGDHRGTFVQGCFFFLGMAAVDDVIRSSALCAGEFGREGGGELVGDPETVCQGR
jgi:hypothetical protein